MKRFYIILWLSAVLLITASWSIENTQVNHAKFDKTKAANIELPVSFQTYDLLVKYAKKYDVPIKIAFGIAKLETGYHGAFHWKYNPNQTSFAYAYGPMQVQQPTASYVWGREITHDELLNDLDFNIETSMKYIAMLNNRYNSWHKALGYYHTGHPVINWYANTIANNANLKSI